MNRLKPYKGQAVNLISQYCQCQHVTTSIEFNSNFYVLYFVYLELQIRQRDIFQRLKYSGKNNNKIHDVEMKAFATERETLESLLNEVVIIQEVFQVT